MRLVPRLLFCVGVSFAARNGQTLRASLESGLTENHIEATLPDGYEIHQVCIGDTPAERLGCHILIHEEIFRAQRRNTDLAAEINMLNPPTKHPFPRESIARMIRDRCFTLSMNPMYTADLAKVSTFSDYSQFTKRSFQGSIELSKKLNLGFAYRNQHTQFSEVQSRTKSISAWKQYKMGSLFNNCMKDYCDEDGLRCTKAYLAPSFLDAWYKALANPTDTSHAINLDRDFGFYFPTAWYLGGGFHLESTLVVTSSTKQEVDVVEAAFDATCSDKSFLKHVSAMGDMSITLQAKFNQEMQIRKSNLSSSLHVSHSQHAVRGCDPNFAEGSQMLEDCLETFRQMTHIPSVIGFQQLMSIRDILDCDVEQGKMYEKVLLQHYRPCVRISKSKSVVLHNKNRNLSVVINAWDWLESALEDESLGEVGQNRACKTVDSYPDKLKIFGICEVTSLYAPPHVNIDARKMTWGWAEACYENANTRRLIKGGDYGKWEAVDHYCGFIISLAEGADLYCYDRIN
uniref:Uncharacterized protein n=1 Tax=Mucochytrium quahogii TaxID=96639 RepID=A0A7S2RNF3_9STRA|mmetsp:Transcript_649/g.826  ORF Transcript_649/g.826 Transcript_649/m.826 type:complete len:515 (-) Transcript_649:294-1838(-)